MVLEIGSVESTLYTSDEIQLWGWVSLTEVGRWNSLTAALTRHRNKWPLTIEGSHHPGWEGRVSERFTDTWMAEVFMSTVALYGSLGREGGGICLLQPGVQFSWQAFSIRG